MNQLDFHNLNYNLISFSSLIEGTLHLNGETILNANIKGTVMMKDSSKLTIERGAVITGNVYCHDVQIFGRIDGEVNSIGVVTVHSSAVINGKIQAKKLAIFPGSIVNTSVSTQEDQTIN
ncbi:polymer-forming cytoskeletal protein [Bacteriovoracaceae bacterium]|nr:polymer-forming cytoskeletal protein [Bacteriovoracaceae bacterium]